MKAQLYGQKVPRWKANEMWRASRQKHIKADMQVNQALNQSIFQGISNFTYGQNSLIIQAASQRINKTA
ncbi:MAG: hypothetical protein ACSHWX_01125 [Maritalea sp.]